MKVKLSKIQIDTNFLEKDSFLAIELKFGDRGIVAFLALLCKMGAATEGEIARDAALMVLVRRGFSRDEAHEFLEYCSVHNFISIGSSDLFLTNSRIAKDQESLGQKQEEFRERKRKERDKLEIIAGQKRDKSECPAGHVNILNNELLNAEPLNLEKGVQGGKPLDWIDAIPILSGLPEAETRLEFAKWRTHLRDKFGKVFDQQMAEAAMLNGAHLGDKFPKAISKSRQNGWKNIIFDSSESSQPESKQQRKLTPTERSFEAVANVQRMLENRGKPRIAE